MTITETQEKKWYIIRTQANREKSISERIKNESEKGDLMGKVSNIIVPIENSFYMKSGKKIKKEKVLYPGYIFVETHAIGELKFYLRRVNGASGFLTNRAGEIQELSQKEVNVMIGIQEELSKETQESTFIIGERVKISDGAFSSLIGTIDTIEGEKVRVSVAIFGRTTPVDLNINQIVKENV